MEKTDCFGYINKNGKSKCLVLTSQECKKGICKFYKTERQLEKEQQINLKRLK